jgi:hypothetical protein
MLQLERTELSEAPVHPQSHHIIELSYVVDDWYDIRVSPAGGLGEGDS